MSQEIRDMLTQRQSQYVWEAYLKHRKHGKTAEVSGSKQGKGAQEVGHNKCCTKKGK